MSTLDLTRAICHQGCELAMWSVYRHYIVDIMVIGYFGGCARCRASGLLVSLAYFVGGIRNSYQVVVRFNMYSYSIKFDIWPKN